ncbi:helix-turn-helix domain-containing protein [Streptomyces parvus]|uniref:helix-turn-helix domain-containing protein n=1 Tax=Streptomyces parvus TaxID=66428 RepID=UPI002100F29F|nr:helix-turn-helix transcriptional regulator [Streptomyces parvus]MCQ1575361.1 helix-turn-helix domain-containing protein [Streptomyces parvus]
MPEPLTAVERVAANVKLLRTRRGWTQNQLAAEMGQKFSQVVATAEIGKRRITVDDLVDFAAAFGVTPEQMMSDDPDAGGHSLYEVTVDGGHTQSFTADTVDPGETWTSFYLRGTQVFLAPTARILGIRLITEEAPDA